MTVRRMRRRLRRRVGPGFPASYYTGPLGSRNILPASQGGALLAVFSGWTGSTQQQKIDRLTVLQTAAGRTIDVVGCQYGGGDGGFGGQDCAFIDDDTVMDWAVTNGSAIYLTFTPGRLTTNSDSVIKQVINGQRDACLDAMAVKLRDKGVRIMLRLFHEFDFLTYHRRADQSLDYATEAAQGQALIDAWRHVVGRFQASNASNVGFYWCPDEGGGSRSLVGLSYPGDTYVDWVGSDRYNHAKTGVFSGCDADGWVSFARIFNHTSAQCAGNQNYHDRFGVANGKPVFIGEVSTRYDSGTPSRKNTWYADIAKAKDPADATWYMSNLIGVSVFDQYVTAENNSDWRIDSNQTSAMADAGTLGSQDPANGRDGWVTWASDGRWKVGVLGGPK